MTLSANSIKPILFIFDFDHTLVKTNAEKDRKSLFLKISDEQYIEKTFSIFNTAKSSMESSLFIVTSRHHSTIPKISKILRIDKSKIITRNFCLSKKEMKKALSTPKNEDEFVKKSIKWKVDTYNKLAKKSLFVVVFDDHANLIKNNPDLSYNVSVIEPFY